jgi:glyoxylase I family protein
MRRRSIKLENVDIAVRDLEATIPFCTDLGLTVVGRDTVSGEWSDTAVGLDEALETAARHGCHPLRGVANYQDIDKLTYVRGPSGILVMLAEELKKA